MTAFNDQLITFTVLISTSEIKDFDAREMFESFTDVVKSYQTDEYGEVNYIHGKCSLTCERMKK